MAKRPQPGCFPAGFLIWTSLFVQKFFLPCWGWAVFRGGVKLWKSTRGPRGVGQAAILLMLSLWIVTVAGAMSTMVHLLLHPEAQTANHHCAMTQFQEGSMAAATGLFVVTAFALTGMEMVSCPEFLSERSIVCEIYQSRGPPLTLTSIMVVS